MLFRNAASPTLTVPQRMTLLGKTDKDNSGSKHGSESQNNKREVLRNLTFSFLYMKCDVMKICLKKPKRALSINTKSLNDKHVHSSNQHIFLTGSPNKGVSYNCWYLRV